MIDKQIKKRTDKLQKDIDNLLDSIVGNAGNKKELIYNLDNNKKYFKKQLNKLMIKYEKDIKLLEKKESAKQSKELIKRTIRS